MVSAQYALRRLREGNQRFVSENLNRSTVSITAQRRQLTSDQAPFAIILGCSDSRVPSELVFDQGLGDLFVIRVAGNVVAPSQIGSVEFAAEQFGTRLVVVLGHSDCGAVKATLDELNLPTANRSPNLRSIVDRIRLPLEPLLQSGQDLNLNTLLDRAIRANIRHSVNALRSGSGLLEKMVEHDGLQIIGAEYSLSSGKVEFFD